MDEFHISKFFDKNFLQIHQKEEKLLFSIDILKKVCGFDVSKNIIEIKNNTLIVRGSNFLKNEVFLKKTLILSELNNNPNKYVFNDIKFYG